MKRKIMKLRHARKSFRKNTFGKRRLRFGAETLLQCSLDKILFVDLNEDDQLDDVPEYKSFNFNSFLQQKGGFIHRFITEIDDNIKQKLFGILETSYNVSYNIRQLRSGENITCSFITKTDNKRAVTFAELSDCLYLLMSDEDKKIIKKKDILLNALEEWFASYVDSNILKLGSEKIYFFEIQVKETPGYVYGVNISFDGFIRKSKSEDETKLINMVNDSNNQTTQQAAQNTLNQREILNNVELHDAVNVLLNVDNGAQRLSTTNDVKKELENIKKEVIATTNNNVVSTILNDEDTKQIKDELNASNTVTDAVAVGIEAQVLVALNEKSSAKDVRKVVDEIINKMKGISDPESAILQLREVINILESNDTVNSIKQKLILINKRLSNEVIELVKDISKFQIDNQLRGTNNLDCKHLLTITSIGQNVALDTEYTTCIKTILTEYVRKLDAYKQTYNENCKNEVLTIRTFIFTSKIMNKEKEKTTFKGLSELFLGENGIIKLSETLRNNLADYHTDRLQKIARIKSCRNNSESYDNHTYDQLVLEENNCDEEKRRKVREAMNTLEPSSRGPITSLTLTNPSISNINPRFRNINNNNNNNNTTTAVSKKDDQQTYLKKIVNAFATMTDESDPINEDFVQEFVERPYPKINREHLKTFKNNIFKEADKFRKDFFKYESDEYKNLNYFVKKVKSEFPNENILTTKINNDDTLNEFKQFCFQLMVYIKNRTPALIEELTDELGDDVVNQCNLLFEKEKKEIDRVLQNISESKKLSVISIQKTLLVLSGIDKKIDEIQDKQVEQIQNIYKDVTEMQKTLHINQEISDEITYSDLINLQNSLVQQIAIRQTLLGQIASYGFTDIENLNDKTNEQLQQIAHNDQLKSELDFHDSNEEENNNNNNNNILSSRAPLNESVEDLLETIENESSSPYLLSPTTSTSSMISNESPFVSPATSLASTASTTSSSTAPYLTPTASMSSTSSMMDPYVIKIYESLMQLSMRYKEMMGINGDDYTVFLRNLKISHEARKRMYYMTQNFVNEINDLIIEAKNLGIKFTGSVSTIPSVLTKKLEVMLSKEAILKGLIGARVLKFGSLKKITSSFKTINQFENLLSLSDANQMYYELIRTKILTLVSLTSIIFSYVYLPGQNNKLDAFVRDAVTYRGAIAHQILIDDREYPLITFYDISDADKFDDLMTSTSGIYWVDLILRLNGNKNPTNTGFFFKKFITPPILSKFIDYFEELEGEYEDDTSVDDKNGGDNENIVTKFMKWFFRI